MDIDAIMFFNRCSSNVFTLFSQAHLRYLFSPVQGCLKLTWASHFHFHFAIL